MPIIIDKSLPPDMAKLVDQDGKTLVTVIAVDPAGRDSDTTVAGEFDKSGKLVALHNLTTRGTPRKRAPKGTFDRAKWQREYQARKRAERAAGNGRTK